MPIDDALKDLKEEIKEKKEEKKEPEKAPPVDNTSSYYKKPWHEAAMKAYIAALNKNYKASSNRAFDASVIELYAPWIRFDTTLSSRIATVSNKRMIEIFHNRCKQETKELLENTDLNMLLEEQIQCDFDVDMDECYEKFPAWMKFKATVGYCDLKMFGELSSVVLVPDLDYLSIFVKDGEVLREYAKTYHQKHPKTDKTSSILEIDRESRIQASTAWQDTMFSPELLVKFCKETGIKNIKSIVYETDEILKTAHALMHAKFRDPEEVRSFRRILYAKAQKYTPELTVK